MKYFEDILPGESRMIGEYRLTQNDIIDYARKWDPQLFHIDPEAAAGSIFSGLIAAGSHLLAISVLKLSTQNPPIAVLAGLGWDEVRFHSPARPGDTLTIKHECIEKRSSNTLTDRGVIRNKITMSNQEGHLVLSYFDAILVAKRPQ